MQRTGPRGERVVIVGVGNPLARDEGLGPAALARLEAEGVPPGALCFDAGTDFLASMPDWADADRLIVIDAMRAGGAPGTVYRMPLEEVEARAKAEGLHLSGHDLGLVGAVRLARVTGQRIPPTVVFGVEPAEVALGEGLSDAVAAALDRLTSAVRKEAAGADA